MKKVVKKLLSCGFRKSFELPEEGRVRVYVGKERENQKKLEVEANLLNHPMLEDLLRLSEEEFGHSYEGALRIACDIHDFVNLIHFLKTPIFINSSKAVS